MTSSLLVREKLPSQHLHSPCSQAKGEGIRPIGGHFSLLFSSSTFIGPFPVSSSPFLQTLPLSNSLVSLVLKRKTSPAWMLPTEYHPNKECGAVLAACTSSASLTPSLVVSFPCYTGPLRSHYSLPAAAYDDFFSAFTLLILSLLEISPLVDGTCLSSREFLFLM